MKLDQNYILKILEAFEDHPDPYMPVALLAKKINDSEKLTEDTGENTEPYCISNMLVFHLLHLQDLEGIENIKGECSWGYVPIGISRAEMDDYIEDSLEDCSFETPHCYMAEDQESIIRLTATGIQMRSALQSGASQKIKTAIIEFGKLAIPSALNLMLKG